MSCFLNIYCIGASSVERFVNYQTWPLIGDSSFQKYHQAQQPLIQIFVVAPVILGFILQVLLLWYWPMDLSRVLNWIAIGTYCIGFASTLLIQLPIHIRFNLNGYSKELMNSLLSSDWIRKAADVVKLIVTFIMIRELLLIRVPQLPGN
jgi:hypothetical protein